ncbi:unnamed protein product [Rhizophagus irregularis]|nr:unnamed protein product [Rhizophagus irregularis]
MSTSFFIQICQSDQTGLCYVYNAVGRYLKLKNHNFNLLRTVGSIVRKKKCIIAFVPNVLYVTLCNLYACIC